MNLIIGNICSLVAMLANAFSSTRKTTKGVLWVQNLSQLIYFACAIVLKGYSAGVQNVVSVVRNLVAIRGIRNRYLEWILVGLGVVLGIAFNNRGIIGLLPVIGNLQYTISVFRFRDNERALKMSFLLSVLSFVVFNVTIFNFVGAVSDLVVVVTTGLVLLRGRRSDRG